MVQLTTQAMTTIHSRMIPKLIEHVATGAKVPDMIYIMEAGDDGHITRSTMLAPHQMEALHEDSESKKDLARFMRGLMEPGSRVRKDFMAEKGYAPNLLIQISEAWMTSKTPAELEVHGGPLVPPAQDPDREEVLAIMFHTLHGSFSVTHPIQTVPARHLTDTALTAERLVRLQGGKFNLQGPSNV